MHPLLATRNHLVTFLRALILMFINFLLLIAKEAKLEFGMGAGWEEEKTGIG